MSSTLALSETAIETPRSRRLDMKFEVAVIPVSDVERAKRFYGSLGWRLGVPRPRMASTRSAPAGEMQTGPTGMPNTW